MRIVEVKTIRDAENKIVKQDVTLEILTAKSLFRTN